MISEKDVSILIPSYKRLDITRKAIESALATGVEEIIVSEDHPDTDIDELYQYNDPRLKIVKQAKNLGLWKNHLFLIRAATKPWLKLLQMDDIITKDCIEKMCAVVTPRTSMVNGLSMYIVLETSETYKDEVINKPHTWTSKEYLERITVVGNELGRPSNSLVKAEWMDISEEAWENDKSCDLIMNVTAAEKGDIVIVPEGLVYIGVHKNQDTFLQSYQLIVSRLKNSLVYLKRKRSKEVDTFVRVYGIVELWGMVRIMLSNIRNRKPFFYKGLVSDFFSIMNVVDVWTFIGNLGLIKRYYRCKFKKEKDIVTILH